MTIKVKITRQGVHDQDRQPVPVGAVLTLDGSTLPAWLVNKAEIVGEASGDAEAVTNGDQDGDNSSAGTEPEGEDDPEGDEDSVKPQNGVSTRKNRRGR